MKTAAEVVEDTEEFFSKILMRINKIGLHPAHATEGSQGKKGRKTHTK